MIVKLANDELGTLDLAAAPFGVESFVVGDRDHRVVEWERANSSGGFDNTKFSGGRGATVGVRLLTSECPSLSMQTVDDLLAPWFDADRRSLLSWVLPGESHDPRGMIVRGVRGPLQIATPKFPMRSLQFVSADGSVVSVGDGFPYSVTIDPSKSVELGRGYNETYDKVYPASDPVGSRSLQVGGTTKADWVLRIYGQCSHPKFTVNDTLIEWPGMAIPAGGWVTVDTRHKTIRYRDEPTQSRYGESNHKTWDWSQLLLNPFASTSIRFEASGLQPGSRAVIEWSPTWA